MQSGPLLHGESVTPKEGSAKPVQFEARAWINAVRNTTGFGLFRLVKRFSEQGTQRELSVEEVRKLLPTWKRYAAGSRRPNVETVLRVEEAVPGTAAWLDFAFWRAISLVPLSLAELRAIHQEVSPDVRRFFFHEGKILNSPLFRRAIKRKAFSYRTANRLGRLGLAALRQTPPRVQFFFDALACAVVLMREAHLIESDDLHQIGNRLYTWLLHGLDLIPEIRPFSRELKQRVREVAGEAIYILHWPRDK